jgi:hypothetical protein
MYKRMEKCRIRKKTGDGMNLRRIKDTARIVSRRTRAKE